MFWISRQDIIVHVFMNPWLKYFETQKRSFERSFSLQVFWGSLKDYMVKGGSPEASAVWLLFRVTSTEFYHACVSCLPWFSYTVVYSQNLKWSNYSQAPFFETGLSAMTSLYFISIIKAWFKKDLKDKILFNYSQYYLEIEIRLFRRLKRIYLLVTWIYF